ncbi:6-phosphofructokinase (pyrophosphate) [Skeletonema marinoi]|uniref:6-phosphofructokinase (Pyrophosphate) n=1 Tax=Skeletonema marinoi TaxID=267567 RepID=A0AAD8YLF6_9STRA|nr:6-phosphofructokinase (pyrophosphate) [Skeletonema marinoi]|mmetsp:Transcript_19804/g.30506  ORF Transcript_19804/g.30506 Transcript_19804/m.30506 type:complete len:410 (+) Transcript_19804:81-1310(+)
MSAAQHMNVAMMTSGGLAPCLSSSVAYLIEFWASALKEGKISGLNIRMYVDGYKGVLTGDSTVISPEIYDECACLHDLGGSPIGNSRVKLTNVKDCMARGFVKEGETPLEVAAQQLIKDDINVIHTIGGDDTNTQAAELSKYILEKHGGKVVVVGMPKTIDNDVYPIVQTFGADTAAEQGAIFFKNVVSESSANPRMLIIHEVMGRDSGYLTAATARKYRDGMKSAKFTGPGFTTTAKSRDIHAVWIPEVSLDIVEEGKRLRKVMDENGCVNVFLSEGAGVEDIVAEMEANGEEVPRDAFGHVSLAKINPGVYFSKRLAELVGAEKTLVQKSGYFARAAASNTFDRQLIKDCAKEGVASAIAGVSGCMGQDEDKAGTPIRAIEFERIKGGKPFKPELPWFKELLADIGM